MCRCRGTARRPGEYNGTFPTTAPGWYEAKIEATRAGPTVGRAVTHFRAAPGERSTSTRRCTPARCGGWPKRPAAATTQLESTSTLADDLRYTGRGVTTVEEHELWHMPIVLLLLVGLLCAEWGYRRVVGLA